MAPVRGVATSTLPITVSLAISVEQVGALAVGERWGVVAAAAAAAVAAWLLNYHGDCVWGMSRGRVWGGRTSTGWAGWGVASSWGARVWCGHILRSTAWWTTAGGAAPAPTSSTSEPVEEAGDVLKLVAQNPANAVAQSLPTKKTGARATITGAARRTIGPSGWLCQGHQGCKNKKKQVTDFNRPQI